MQQPKNGTPPEQMLAHLERARSRGETFEKAWDAAMSGRGKRGGVRWPHDTPARREWREALSSTRAEWAAAWAGQPTRAAGLIDALRSHSETGGADALDLSGEIAA